MQKDSTVLLDSFCGLHGNMVVNKKILEDISPFFTEKVLIEVVAKDKNVNPDEVQVISCDFNKRASEGESYISVLSKLIVVSKVGNELLETEIIVKSFPKSIGARKTLRSQDFFKNEIMFYEKVIIIKS